MPDAKGADEVVRVHEDVGEAVDAGAKGGGAAAVAEVEEEPPDWADGGVVVEVQERHLAVLLAKGNEDGVKKVEELGEVVHKDPEFANGRELRVERKQVWQLHACSWHLNPLPSAHCFQQACFGCERNVCE